MTSQVPASFTCANTGDLNPNSSPCSKKATSICTSCYLVQYCSRDCQKAHWSTHKTDCKSPLMKSTWKPSWETEGRRPAFATLGYGQAPNNGPSATVYGTRKYLWGNVPALDVLNLEDNEGVDTKRDLRLLFAASGDLRNVLKTVTALPNTYTGKCDLVLNDHDPTIVLRNAIFLLVALHVPPPEAAPIILHLWYSSLIPSFTLLSLQKTIAPLVQDVCSKIAGKASDSLQAKTWTTGASSVRIVLKKEQWMAMQLYLQLPDDFTAEQAQELRRATALAPERVDYLHRGLFSLAPARRVGMMRFRGDGMLLPFGAERRSFDVPNPTIFQSRDFWPMMDSADPLHGWAIDDVMDNVPSARNDLYGGLYFYVYGLLLEFCERSKGMRLAFALFQGDAQELPNVLRTAGLGMERFDRIEVSNISDGGYIGIARVISTFIPLLCSKLTNPHATLLTLFLNAIAEMDHGPSPSTVASAKSDMVKALKYMPAPSDADVRLRSTSAAMCEWIECRNLFTDYDKIFESYMRKLDFAKMKRLWSVRMKERHTVVEKWPLRLRDNATKEEFEMLRQSSFTGSERYVEWVHA